MPFARRSWNQDEGYDEPEAMSTRGGYDTGGISTYEEPSLYNPPSGRSAYGPRGSPGYDPEALGNKPFKIRQSWTNPEPGGGYGPQGYPGGETPEPYYGIPTKTGGEMTMVSGVPTYGGSAFTGPSSGVPPNIPLPEMKLPPFDESRISELEQKAAAPGYRKLRQSVREVQGKYYENPNVKRMTLRDALAGYGAGIENVMTGARREAQAEYQEEFRPKVQKAQMEYQAQVQGLMQQYQNAWRDYMSRMGNARF